MAAEAGVKGGLTRRDRGNAPATTSSRSQAEVVIELETGQVDMGEAYVRTLGVSKHMPSWCF